MIAIKLFLDIINLVIIGFILPKVYTVELILINSMSRTGTSLLYQLLHGAREIQFPPYRVQMVCSKPYGFPFNGHDKEAFVSNLLNKTTIPINTNEKTDWTNIEIKRLSEIIKKNQVDILNDNYMSEETAQPIENALSILDSLYPPYPMSAKYLCLHDDHSFTMGNLAFKEKCVKKILTTIRKPIDMIASKKNMLVFHCYKKRDPATVELTEISLKREYIRALFSWLIASYEYDQNQRCLPILFRHLKGDLREQTMINVSNYLEIDYSPILLEEAKPESNQLNGELLYAGSSLKALTDGKKSTTVNSSKVCLTNRETQYIEDNFDTSYTDQLINLPFESFYERLGNLWRDISLHGCKELNNLWNLYQAEKYSEVFELYSSYNYGRLNADEAIL